MRQLQAGHQAGVGGDVLRRDAAVWHPHHEAQLLLPHRERVCVCGGGGGAAARARPCGGAVFCAPHPSLPALQSHPRVQANAMKWDFLVKKVDLDAPLLRCGFVGILCVRAEAACWQACPLLPERTRPSPHWSPHPAAARTTAPATRVGGARTTHCCRSARGARQHPTSAACSSNLRHAQVTFVVVANPSLATPPHKCGTLNGHVAAGAQQKLEAGEGGACPHNVPVQVRHAPQVALRHARLPASPHVLLPWTWLDSPGRLGAGIACGGARAR